MPLGTVGALIDVALGREPADLTIINGTLLNVYTGELLDGYAVAAKGIKIAYVGPNGQHTIGKDTQVIDAQGMLLIPGLIEGHTHGDMIYPPDQLVHWAMRGGTTTVITETSMVGNALGYEGILFFLEAIRNQPIKVFVTAPACVPPNPVMEESHQISLAEMEDLLEREEVVGLGETYWSFALEDQARFLPLLDLAKKKRKIVDGHSAGARDKKLAAYATLGISSCHEPITAGEVVERARLGLYVMVREGFIRQDLTSIAPLKDMEIDFRRLCFGTDGISPRQFVEEGYMDFVVQKAINLGFDPIKAIQMATLNTAERFGLDGILGAIAPGKDADILIIPDLHTIKGRYLVSKGRLAARDNEILLPARIPSYPDFVFTSIRLPRQFTAADFHIPADGQHTEAKVRVIQAMSDLITQETHLTVAVDGGCLTADGSNDVVKVAVIQRHTGTGKHFVGLMKGFGMKSGAVAGSVCWDATNLGVIGASDTDMAFAISRVAELGGGMVAVAGGRVLAELPFPVGGIISPLPMAEIAKRYDAVGRAAKALGATLSDPLLCLQTITASFLPFLRITERGLIDVRENRLVDILVH